jgi:hypothetical protein
MDLELKTQNGDVSMSKIHRVLPTTKYTGPPNASHVEITPLSQHYVTLSLFEHRQILENSINPQAVDIKIITAFEKNLPATNKSHHRPIKNFQFNNSPLNFDIPHVKIFSPSTVTQTFWGEHTLNKKFHNHKKEFTYFDLVLENFKLHLRQYPECNIEDGQSRRTLRKLIQASNVTFTHHQTCTHSNN